jgi:pimeloyl-ACP methyl ester carboxylesterase
MNHSRRISLALLAVLAWTTAAADTAGVQRYYEVHGARLYVEKFGHGPPVLFLHGGLMFFDNSFKNQRDYFASYRTVIGIDQRSHGHSPDGDWALSYRLMAEDTAAIIAQLHVGPVDVVGISDGGNIALLLARDHPELVRRVVISGANLRSGLTPEQAQQQRTLPADALATKLKRIEDTVPQNFRPDYARVSPDGPDHWNTLVRKDYFMWIQPIVIEPADLKKIQAPVLVMAGDNDLTSLEETIEIYRGLPHAELMIVPGCNHGTFLHRPVLVNLAVREFLDPPKRAAPH